MDLEDKDIKNTIDGELGQELDKDLDIDKNALDFECIEQPKRFLKWARILSDAIKQRDWAKRRTSIKRSEISVDIRSNPNKYGLDKATEGSVAATLETLPEISQVENDHIDAQRAVNILTSAKEAFEQRKSMVEKLIPLYLSGYWSRPKEPNESVGKMADEGTKELKTNLNLKMRR